MYSTYRTSVCILGVSSPGLPPRMRARALLNFASVRSCLLGAASTADRSWIGEGCSVSGLRVGCLRVFSDYPTWLWVVSPVSAHVPPLIVEGAQSREHAGRAEQAGRVCKRIKAPPASAESDLSVKKLRLFGKASDRCHHPTLYTSWWTAKT